MTRASVGARRHAQKIDDERARDPRREGAAAIVEAVGEPALAEDAEVQVDDGERAVAVDLAGERLNRQLQRQQRQLQRQLGTVLRVLGQPRDLGRRDLVRAREA